MILSYTWIRHFWSLRRSKKCVNITTICEKTLVINSIAPKISPREMSIIFLFKRCYHIICAYLCKYVIYERVLNLYEREIGITCISSLISTTTALLQSFNFWYLHTHHKTLLQQTIYLMSSFIF